MENLKLVHQLFIGKVADEIGMERTTELLKEAKEAFAIPVVVRQSEQLCQHKYQDIRYGTSRCVICGKEEQSFQAQLRTTVCVRIVAMI